jgi:hypothetical protein
MPMKMPLSWHKECLVNQRANAAREDVQEKDRAARTAREIAYTLEYVRLYEEKIRQVEAAGKDGFDTEVWERKIPSRPRWNDPLPERCPPR